MLCAFDHAQMFFGVSNFTLNVFVKFQIRLENDAYVASFLHILSLLSRSGLNEGTEVSQKCSYCCINCQPKLTACHLVIQSGTTMIFAGY